MLPIIIQSSFASVLDGDIYWHIKSGEDFLFHGLNPYIDHYSVDLGGAHIKYYTLFFDGIAAVFFKLFHGELGLQFLYLALILLPIFYILFICLQKKCSGIVFLWVASLVTMGLTLRNIIRPEMISYIFTAIFMTFLLERKYDRRSLVTLLILSVIWAHFHVTGTFSYIILAGLYLDAVIQLRKTQSSLKQYLELLTLGLLSFLAGFINYGFEHPLFQVLQFDQRWETWIVEFFPVPFFSRDWQIQYIFIFSALLCPLLILKRNWGAFFVLSVFLFQSFKMYKIFPHLVIVSGMILFSLLMNYQFKIVSLPKILKNFVYICIWAFIVLNLSTSIKLLVRLPFIAEMRPNPKIFPVDLIDHLRTQVPSGNILNNYIMGGYLLYHLGPKVKVAIDGRTNILYPYDYFIKTMEAYSDVNKFNKFIDLRKYDAVVDNLYTSQSLVDTALESRKFGFSYVTANNAYLKPIAKSEYPLSSFYFRFPQCYKDSEFGKIIKEVQIAAKSLPSDSQLRVFHAIVYRYNESKDKLLFLQSLLNGPQIYYSSLRFAAYQALKLNQPLLSLNLFLKARADYKPRDLVYIVELLCKYHDCKGAQEFFLFNVDRVMRKWQREALLRQFAMLQKKLGNDFQLHSIKSKIQSLPENLEDPYPGLDPCSSTQ